MSLWDEIQRFLTPAPADPNRRADKGYDDCIARLQHELDERQEQANFAGDLVGVPGAGAALENALSDYAELRYADEVRQYCDPLREQDRETEETPSDESEPQWCEPQEPEPEPQPTEPEPEPEPPPADRDQPDRERPERQQRESADCEQTCERVDHNEGVTDVNINLDIDVNVENSQDVDVDVNLDFSQRDNVDGLDPTDVRVAEPVADAPDSAQLPPEAPSYEPPPQPDPPPPPPSDPPPSSDPG